MIVKGAPRGGPTQLAQYLLRVNKDTEERADMLELQSAWAQPDSDKEHIASQLVETFRDWQLLTEGTQQGRDGLYHAQISPEGRYATGMTEQQWKRTADILGEELGLKDQPRALVLHSGKDGRPHLHVVWARTDADAMKLVSDSYNYVAHERASHRMELEFGHEFVPGKHAKRDRKRQPEFPKADFGHDERLQSERTGLTPAARKEQITALQAAADSGQAFKAALEDAGYILAKGHRGYVIVDQAGGHYNLARQLDGMKTKELRAFMAGVDLDQLPTIEEAKALLEAREVAPVKTTKGGEQGEQTSQFLPQPAAPQPQPPAPPAQDAELEALKKALDERDERDLVKLLDYHALQLRQKEHDLGLLNDGKISDLDAGFELERDALREKHRQERSGLKGVIDAIESRWNPALAAEKTKQRRHEQRQLLRRQKKERADHVALIEQTKQQELENLKERHGQQLRDRQEHLKEDRERYIREHHEAKKMLAELEAERLKELERNDSLREGPPPPKLGKS
jgi:hypothetical protein